MPLVIYNKTDGAGESFSGYGNLTFSGYTQFDFFTTTASFSLVQFTQYETGTVYISSHRYGYENAIEFYYSSSSSLSRERVITTTNHIFTAPRTETTTAFFSASTSHIMSWQDQFIVTGFRDVSPTTARVGTGTETITYQRTSKYTTEYKINSTGGQIASAQMVYATAGFSLVTADLPPTLRPSYYTTEATFTEGRTAFNYGSLFNQLEDNLLRLAVNNIIVTTSKTSTESYSPYTTSQTTYNRVFTAQTTKKYGDFSVPATTRSTFTSTSIGFGGTSTKTITQTGFYPAGMMKSPQRFVQMRRDVNTLSSPLPETASIRTNMANQFTETSFLSVINESETTIPYFNSFAFSSLQTTGGPTETSTVQKGAGTTTAIIDKSFNRILWNVTQNFPETKTIKWVTTAGSSSISTVTIQAQTFDSIGTISRPRFGGSTASGFVGPFGLTTISRYMLTYSEALLYLNIQPTYSFTTPFVSTVYTEYFNVLLPIGQYPRQNNFDTVFGQNWSAVLSQTFSPQFNSTPFYVLPKGKIIADRTTTSVGVDGTASFTKTHLTSFYISTSNASGFQVPTVRLSENKNGLSETIFKNINARGVSNADTASNADTYIQATSLFDTNLPEWHSDNAFNFCGKITKIYYSSTNTVSLTSFYRISFATTSTNTKSYSTGVVAKVTSVLGNLLSALGGAIPAWQVVQEASSQIPIKVYANSLMKSNSGIYCPNAYKIDMITANSPTQPYAVTNAPFAVISPEELSSETKTLGYYIAVPTFLQDGATKYI
jgi:hypothetical protein